VVQAHERRCGFRHTLRLISITEAHVCSLALVCLDCNSKQFGE
jgi:hypothetical protein